MFRLVLNRESYEDFLFMEPVSKNFYAVITAPVLYSTKITARQKLMVAIISNLSNEKGYCWASNAHFAEIMNCDERSIQRDLSDLEEKNFISRVVHRNEDGSVNYRAIFIVEHQVTNLSGGGDRSVMRGGDKSVTIINNTIKNNIKKKKEKKEIETPKGDPSALQPQSFSLEEIQLQFGEEFTTIEAGFLNLFNTTTGRTFKVVDAKTLRQLKALISSGYRKADMEKAIKNAMEDKFHKDEKYKYLTPEFITRMDKFQKFLNIEPTKTNEMKEQMDAFKFFEQAEAEAKRSRVE